MPINNQGSVYSPCRPRAGPVPINAQESVSALETMLLRSSLVQDDGLVYQSATQCESLSHISRETVKEMSENHIFRLLS